MINELSPGLDLSLAPAGFLPQAGGELIGQTLTDQKLAGIKFNQELKKAATDLEALHINNLLSELRSSEQAADDLFGGSLAQEFFKEMLDEQYAKLMADSGNFGLAQILVEQNKRT